MFEEHDATSTSIPSKNSLGNKSATPNVPAQRRVCAKQIIAIKNDPLICVHCPNVSERTAFIGQIAICLFWLPGSVKIM